MAKKATITPVTDTVNNAAAINTQLNAINNKLDNTLSLDGSVPNAMGADLDLNSNDILNANNIYAADIIVAGSSVSASATASAASAAAALVSENNASTSATQAAQYDGIWLDDVAALLADTTLTYTAGQPSTVVVGDYVRTRKEGFAYQVATVGDVTTAGGIQLDVIAGDGSYNVLAFGAVGDGITDDTTAIQNAINAAATNRSLSVLIPPKHYIVSTLYDHYDVTLNPNFPSGAFYEGRVSLDGIKAADWPQLNNLASDYSGCIIETNSATGPAIKLGNGDGASSATARRTSVKNIAFLGTCTSTVVDMDASVQHVVLEHLTIFNDGGVGGKALYIHDGAYTSNFYNLHISSNGTNGNGVVVEDASLVNFDTVNVTNCGGTAWVIGAAPADATDTRGGTGSTYTNCQGRNSHNGLEIMGGRSNTFTGWWLEQNSGEFDLKVHGNAVGITFNGMMATSTVLTEASVIIGGSSGTSYLDACRGITLNAFYFAFVGPSGVSGLKKTGACTDLTVKKCSWKNNGGRAIEIDTTLGVTPTILEDCDFLAVGSGAVFGGSKFCVDQTGSSAAYLVRGLSDRVETITADLNMSTWTHLPDAINVQTGTNITVTLPTNGTKVKGKTMTLRKTVGGNTLTVSGNIAGAASITATALDSITTVIAHGNASMFGQLS